MGTADLHIHSIYSHDATTTIRAILKHAADVGLDLIAITDHDEIRGSVEAQQISKEYKVEVISGAEISTSDGHLIALFIDKLPPPGMSLLTTLLNIHEQGGLAIVPHPFNKLPNSLSTESVLTALINPQAAKVLKGIETHNMGTQQFDKVAQKLAKYLPLAPIASSDAHVYWAIGAGRTEFPGNSAKDLRKALESNTTVPIPYEGDLSAKSILSWTRKISLKKIGFDSGISVWPRSINLAGDSTTDAPPPKRSKRKK